MQGPRGLREQVAIEELLVVKCVTEITGGWERARAENRGT